MSLHHYCIPCAKKLFDGDIESKAIGVTHYTECEECKETLTVDFRYTSPGESNTVRPFVVKSR